MSGGYFDYRCFDISSFAEDLQREIDANSGSDGFGYSQETMNRLGTAKDIIDVAAMLAREVEWLYSGDHSEESFQRLVDEILADEAEERAYQEDCGYYNTYGWSPTHKRSA